MAGRETTTFRLPDQKGLKGSSPKRRRKKRKDLHLSYSGKKKARAADRHARTCSTAPGPGLRKESSSRPNAPINIPGKHALTRGRRRYGEASANSTPVPGGCANPLGCQRKATQKTERIVQHKNGQQKYFGSSLLSWDFIKHPTTTVVPLRQKRHRSSGGLAKKKKGRGLGTFKKCPRGWGFRRNTLSTEGSYSGGLKKKVSGDKQVKD